MVNLALPMCVGVYGWCGGNVMFVSLFYVVLRMGCGCSTGSVECVRHGFNNYKVKINTY